MFLCNCWSHVDSSVSRYCDHLRNVLHTADMLNVNNCSLCIMLMATDQKLQKSWKGDVYPSLCSLSVNVMLSNITFLWFFCCFWSVAINIVYKLQFLTSIFTVLLPGLSTSSLYSFRRFRRGSWKLSELAAPWMITVLSLCVVVDPDTFSSLFHHFMHRNGCVSTYSSTSAISVVLSKVSFMLRVEIVVIWQHTRQFLSTLSLCMCRTAIFEFPIKIQTLTFNLATPVS